MYFNSDCTALMVSRMLNGKVATIRVDIKDLNVKAIPSQ